MAVISIARISAVVVDVIRILILLIVLSYPVAHSWCVTTCIYMNRNLNFPFTTIVVAVVAVAASSAISVTVSTASIIYYS